MVKHKLEDYLEDFSLSLILSLGVSFYARLEDRKAYVTRMTQVLKLQPLEFVAVIETCQKVFIDEMRLEKTIAKNDALMENVWMMAICIELRIPLFLVGKPGSSKSLAKSIVTEVMEGANSYSDLFKAFKEIHMVSFQCSPLATAGGILSTFKQCQKYQEKRDLNTFTAVCILDEVGLAEDSAKMPLKVRFFLIMKYLEKFLEFLKLFWIPASNCCFRSSNRIAAVIYLIKFSCFLGSASFIGRRLHWG